jgi:hypothetical protein
VEDGSHNDEGEALPKWRLMLPAVPIAGLIAGVSAPATAFAYGNAAVHQLTFSLNCNDRSSPLCTPSAFGYGGEWGWIELDGNMSGGTADVQLTGCTHLGGGAGHEAISDTAWMQVTDSPATLLASGVVTVGANPFSQASGKYLVIPDAGLAFPVQMGHYALTLAPQVFEQVTVAP